MLKRVYLELTNACNLNCSFCSNPKGNRFLDIKQIDNYLIQIKEYCNYIYLHILGEPTLHPDFNEILNLLDKYDFNLQLVSNGTLLNKYPDLLNHKCLRKLSISIHSVSNLDIENSYFETIDNLINNNTNTKIELRFYDKYNLSKDIQNYLDRLKEKYAFEITSKDNSYKLKENTYIYFEDLFRWPNINDPFISNTGTCHGAIDMIGINSNSDVTICCLDPYAHNKIGNLNNDSLKNILNSKEYLKYIDEFRNNKITSDLCSKCSYRLRFKS